MKVTRLLVVLAALLSLNTLGTAPKPKVDPAVAEALNAETEGVIACINTIGTT